MDIRLIYFDMPFWRAEVARLPLFIASIKFDDFRITDDDNSYLKENGKLKDGTLTVSYTHLTLPTIYSV